MFTWVSLFGAPLGLISSNNLAVFVFMDKTKIFNWEKEHTYHPKLLLNKWNKKPLKRKFQYKGCNPRWYCRARDCGEEVERYFRAISGEILHSWFILKKKFIIRQLVCQVIYSLSKKKVKNLAALNKAKERDQYQDFQDFLQLQLFFATTTYLLLYFSWKYRDILWSSLMRSHKSLKSMKGVIFPDTHLGRT